jgi:Heterokaryon incompatibility protein (HET)
MACAGRQDSLHCHIQECNLRNPSALLVFNFRLYYPSPLCFSFGAYLSGMRDATQSALYRTLDTSKRQIRLVHLQPSIGFTAIHCRLVTANLDQNPCPEYEALSYEWEAPLDSHSSPSPSIIIGGRRVVVRNNLLWALWHLRLTNEIRVLWIDALCINQEDTAERNHQVTWMGEIYKRASRVVIWLGHKRPQNEFGDIFDTIRRIRSWKSILSHPLLGAEGPRGSHAPQEAWSLVDNFCNQTYWKRLWIIQEVISASFIIIQYGDRYCTWDLLENMLDQFQDGDFRQYLANSSQRGYLSRVDSILDTVPARLCQQRLEQGAARYNHSLLDLILRYHDAKCHDLRDKVFGLHSLVKKCCRQEVPVDYSKSPLQICQNVLQHHLVCHSPDASEEALRIMDITRRLSKTVIAESAEVRETFIPDITTNKSSFVYSSKTIDFRPDLIHLACYLRGTILYADRPAQISKSLRVHKKLSAFPMPVTLNQAIRASMRSYLKDAKRYLPTTTKPDNDDSDGPFARLGTLCSQISNAIVPSLRKQSTWKKWLRSLKLEEDLWAHYPFVFFTGDGHIGLAAEAVQIGDIVCEFDGRKADCIILRKASYTVGNRFLIVGTSHKVLGASGPTPKGSLQRVTISMDLATLQSLSERFDDTCS